MARFHDFERWTREELRRAENAADRFLDDHQEQICRSVSEQLELLTRVVNVLRSGALTRDERLHCLARVAEISAEMNSDADAFFALASEPLVARLVSTVKR